MLLLIIFQIKTLAQTNIFQVLIKLKTLEIYKIFQSPTILENSCTDTAVDLDVSTAKQFYYNHIDTSNRFMTVSVVSFDIIKH